MNNLQIFIKWPIFIMITLLAITCSSDNDAIDSFADLIQSGGDFPDVNKSTSSAALDESETIQGDEVWTCTTTRVSVEDALGGDNGFSLFSPNANVVYPGNLIQGKSLNKATPDEILADRQGGEITISILDGNDLSFVEVEEITLGQVTDAANQILAGKDENSVIPSNFTFDKSIVQSEREFALRIKADFENAWANVSGSLSFSENSTYSRMMVSLEQTFYTLSFGAPSRVEDFFASTTRPEDLTRFIGPGNPPCYISSVNYGRIFYMLIESSASESELQAAVEASFSGLTNSGGGSVEIDNFESMSEVNIKIFALGGDAAVTIEAGGINKGNLNKINDILKRATDIRTAVPISYKAQSVYTNEVVAVQLATDYERKVCTVTSALPPPPITAHWKGVTDLLDGPVGATVNLDPIRTDIAVQGPIRRLFFDSLGVRCVVDDGSALSGPYESIEDLIFQWTGNQVDFPLEDIGAGGCRVIMSGSFHVPEIILINKLGNKMVFMDRLFAFSDAFPIGAIPYIDHFETQGIGAACDYGPSGYITVNQLGNLCIVQNYAGDAWVLGELPIQLFTGGTDVNYFAEGISAITRLDEFVIATVDKSGKRYMVVDLAAQPAKYFGPFKL